MDRRTMLERKQEIVDRYGEWTAHNIRLGEGVSTLGDFVSGDEYRLRRVLQIVGDLVERPFEDLRVLDLACLEGLYSIELAQRGAEVVGIEGREANVAKAQFAKDVLGLRSVEFVQDDVRNLSRERYGEFDVVLCIGILYHLDSPDVFDFLWQIADVCRRLAVIDTHVALSPRSKRRYRDDVYYGISYVEHSAATTASAREKLLWASLDNPRSFWPTRPSLLNALGRAGFSTVSECGIPARRGEQRDRLTFLATKGPPQIPATTAVAPDDLPAVPERRWKRPIVSQLRGAPLLIAFVHGVEARWHRRR